MQFYKIVAVFAATATLFAFGRAEAIPVDELVRDYKKYLNTTVTVIGTVAAAEALPAEAAIKSGGKNRFELALGAGKLPVLTNRSLEAIADDSGRTREITGKLIEGPDGIHLVEGSPVNWLLYGGIGALALVALLLAGTLLKGNRSASPSVVTAPPMAGGGALSLPMAPCVACGKSIPAMDQFCEHCGADQRAQMMTAPPVVPESMSGAASGTVIESASADATSLDQLVGNIYVKEGDLRGKFFPIGGRPVTLGRDGCTIRLSGDNVSRTHAEIKFDGNQLTLVDRDSTNGTYVNDERIQKHLLQNGDVIKIGNNELVFEQR